QKKKRKPEGCSVSPQVAGVAAVPVTLSLMSGTVFAAAEDKPNVTLNTNELSLYTTPQQKFRYVEPDIGHLEPGVTTLRKLAEPYVTWCQNISFSLVPELFSVLSETFTFLQNPPAEFYPLVAVIGFPGIIGLFLARGSRVKKLIYPTGLMAAGYSMYYPQVAASITKVSERVNISYVVCFYLYLHVWEKMNIVPFFNSATTPVEGKVSSSCQVQN
uniref:MICOS complex subunit n=1 Tax=Salmo trutta TaxID=8032 RepID=A0A674EHR6_SALTR